jgi:hypothetical protein
MPTQAGRIPVAFATSAISRLSLVPSAAAVAIQGLIPACAAKEACVSGVAYLFITPLQFPATTGSSPRPAQ